MNEYHKAGEDFLKKYNLKFSAVRVTPNTGPKWADKKWDGQHWYITIEREGLAKNPALLQFDFWTGQKYDKIGKSQTSFLQKLPAYDVLACISSDLTCPETFADFCSDYGYESDSIKARQTFETCYEFAGRLRAFFSRQEQEDLQQIS